MLFYLSCYCIILGPGGGLDEEVQGREGGGVAQLKPSISFCSECSYCFMGFTLGCQTTLACLLPCLTSVHATPGGRMLAPETYKTHPRRREQTWDCAAASCKTKCYCSVKKTAVDMFAMQEHESSAKFNRRVASWITACWGRAGLKQRLKKSRVSQKQYQRNAVHTRLIIVVWI